MQFFIISWAVTAEHTGFMISPRTIIKKNPFAFYPIHKGHLFITCAIVNAPIQQPQQTGYYLHSTDEKDLRLLSQQVGQSL